MLNEHEIERYSRQLILPGFGTAEQQQICDARLMLAGDFPVLERYLRGAGMTTIVDDTPEIIVRGEESPRAPGAEIDLCIGEHEFQLTVRGVRVPFSLPASFGRHALEAAAASFLLRLYFRPTA